MDHRQGLGCWPWPTALPSGPSPGGVLSHLASHCCVAGGRRASVHSRDGCPVWLVQCTERCCWPRPHCTEHCGDARLSCGPVTPDPAPAPAGKRGAHLPRPTRWPPSVREGIGAGCSAWWRVAWLRAGSGQRAGWPGDLRSCRGPRGGGGLARSSGCTAGGEAVRAGCPRCRPSGRGGELGRWKVSP